MIQSTKQNLLFIVSTILTAFSAASIMAFTDPENAGWVTFFFLYLSIFLTFLSILSVIGLTVRKWFFKKNVFVVNLTNSFRQALLVSILIIISLILSSQGLLFWWVEASLILFLLFFEIFFNLKV